jgi:hypothetical protein
VFLFVLCIYNHPFIANVGMANSAKTLGLSPELLKLIHQKWTDEIYPVTGLTSYEEMRTSHVYIN